MLNLYVAREQDRMFTILTRQVLANGERCGVVVAVVRSLRDEGKARRLQAEFEERFKTLAEHQRP